MSPDSGDPYSGKGDHGPVNLDLAFDTAALAGLSHADRESKRRSLLAAQALGTQRLDIAAHSASVKP